MKKVLFEKIQPTLKQIQVLYEQLKLREHSISHTRLPTFNDHKHFVENNPYREWFLIEINDKCIGNIYIQFDNSIGLNCDDQISENHLKEVLNYIYEHFRPLKPIPSVRFKDFFVNVAASNLILQRKLIKVGFSEHQRTFISKRNEIF